LSQIAVIPARGGSKRILKKNIRIFHGKPIIAYAIDECFKSGLFSRVIVSTDDVEIAQVAEKFGAEVFLREDQQISSDSAPVISVVKELIHFRGLESESDSICCVFPCSPLLTYESLTSSFEILQNNEVDFVFPVFNSGLPISRSLFINPDGYVEMLNKDFRNTATNLLTESLFDAGQYYWAKTRTWIESESILGGINMPYFINRLSAVDIDNEEDWLLAEILFAKHNEGEQSV
jgi:N-acylneuraminate cytidylyltransferase